MLLAPFEEHAMTSAADSTPICRCRVLYLGSSVPQQTKDGLQGIQQPLRELYPEEGAAGARGIDSWLSVWSNGVLLENVDENHKKITRFFPIESLHYCAAVRYVLVPEKNALHSPTPRFLPLDSPFARTPDPAHPPLFAAILRRTSGIKVLECHAFICKREVAANALVRCCFHAYADSSYAKQVDTAGSIYGTLASERLSTNGKVDDWKTSRSQLGSTTTLNTIDQQHSPKDDVSIYNGDENHKVWAGSQDNLDGIYDVYSTGTISRPHRPRQIAQPVAVPPPPPAKDKKKKTKPSAKSSLGGSREDLYNGKPGGSVSGSVHKQRGQHSYAAGPGSNVGGYGANVGGHGSNVGGYGSNVGGYGSNVGGYMAQHMGGPGANVGGPQPIYIMAPRPGTLPNPKFFKQHGNTYSHRARGKVLIPARPIPPPMVPMAPVIIPASTMQKSKKKLAKYGAEEPIYRALSPQMAVNFGHYATVESQGKQKKAHKDRERERNHQAKLNKKLAQSMNGLDDPNLTVNDESPFNTGIYKKKGHLNERAFSYSIRQEHRSRSYGSLANLKFATPIPNGEVEDIREDLKKEREIMQMVQDLDLSSDEIERSEMPQGVYGARGGMIPPGPVIVTASQMNGRGHRR